jgi:ribosomal protein S18 acetylase RimI-like enzyme
MVRPATIEDADAIARVQVETWRAAYGHALAAQTLAAVDIGRRAELWRGWIRDGRSATFVGEADGEVVGFANVGASQDHPGLGELYAIYVLQEAWGTGVGPALIERGEAELRARGFTTATLNVLADNPRARRFYERHGWIRGETFTSSFLGQEVELARHRKDLSITAGV